MANTDAAGGGEPPRPLETPQATQEAATAPKQFLYEPKHGLPVVSIAFCFVSPLTCLMRALQSWQRLLLASSSYMLALKWDLECVQVANSSSVSCSRAPGTVWGRTPARPCSAARAMTSMACCRSCVQHSSHPAGAGSKL